MTRITIKLDDELIQQVKQAAAEVKMTQNQWLASLIQQRLANNWPQVVRDMAGSWQEFPQQEELRAALGEDKLRDSLKV
ncbi:MAG: CopG family transcriptional regulator [Rheinheimera sp.]|uniref:CopG family transcriptional regulator n=1 Tax=Arsukibacterium sp. UBA3155 TaxID=1946058 RepID=UPI000C8B97B3|nr:CopG family transcriptional regulator [Arsukibacterium sp. UBA3155]MAD75536.1 CopG family transcriptional regulator [Rheinheimera sp.]|tara:strand:+ start:52027 stop:52263 length:237 start_codon:yes stop_codon:yes gene_type:complete